MRAPGRPLKVALCVVPLLGGCALFSSQVEVSRRYKQVENAAVDCGPTGAGSTDCYEATVSALPVPGGDNSLAATALSDRGQAAYIAALAAAAKDDASALKTALAAPAKPPGTSAAYADLTALKLRFVIGLFPTNGYLNPSDRLSWASVTIAPLTPGQGTAAGAETTEATPVPARFVSWTQVANREEVLDVGSVSASRTDKITADTGIVGIGKPLADTTAGAEFSATRTETADIKDRVAINAVISGGVARIVQNGGWRRNLTGNATFDATIQLPPSASELEFFTTVGPLVPKKKTDGSKVPDWTPASELKLGFQQRRIPKAQPLCARVTLDFVGRKTGMGHTTFTESDDHVTFLRGRTSSIQSIAPPLIVPRWVIEAPGVGPLQIDFDDGGYGILQFDNKEEALAFLAWLRGERPAGGRIANGRLRFDRRPLDLKNYPGVDATYPKAKSDWEAANKPCR